ncbi:sporulation protein YqfD [Sporolactobacillus terrae]|uniref:Sporulation protein YqfD n=1 Tax=Sporolactobacillus terrae TaxID=269673 RepID=A0A5K7X3F5_9BACL|nr:sporulation protein YqfD [Sporolactobacillus terrae]BBN99230.1 sporulation protein YqfD [Sporolactobacillus terrae]
MRHLLHRTEGYLRAEIIGAEPERFIRIGLREQIRIWNIMRTNETTLTCSIALTDSNALRMLLKESKCRIHILEKNGLPFYLRKLKLRLGITAGLLFFMMLLLMLSNMVWSVRIDGADPKLADQIRNILRQNHLYEGSLDLFVPDTSQLENALSTKLTKVTWIGVSRKGTTYRINVVEKKYPQPKEVSGPRNLVAAKQAVVQRLYVENGQPLVESDQFVKAGQVLVSGKIGSDESFKFVSSRGKVIGETWYRSEMQIPMTNHYTLYTGKDYNRYQLKMWHMTVSLWGFKKQPFKAYDLETVRKPIRFLIWRTPFVLIKQQYRQTKQVTRQLTVAQATRDAIESSEKKLLDQLPEDAKILNAVIDYKKIVRGQLYLRTHQVVHENIAVPKAINIAKEKKKMKKKPQ